MTTISNNWILEESDLLEIPEGYYGFVYRITDRTTNKQYIGKKLFYSSKTRQIKGKKKKTKVESDWKSYYGSNEELLKQVNESGQQNFERRILRLCKTKGECTYYESKYQFEENVLLLPEKYYNTWIMCKVHRKHLKLTDAG